MRMRLFILYSDLLLYMIFRSGHLPVFQICGFCAVRWIGRDYEQGWPSIGRWMYDSFVFPVKQFPYSS